MNNLTNARRIAAVVALTLLVGLPPSAVAQSAVFEAPGLRDYPENPPMQGTPEKR